MDFDTWIETINNLSFEDRAFAIRDKIIENLQVVGDKIQQQCFIDCFDYVFKLYKQNKPLEVSLLKIYLKDIKGYKDMDMHNFITISVLLSLCGFELSEYNES